MLRVNIYLKANAQNRTWTMLFKCNHQPRHLTVVALDVEGEAEAAADA